MPTQTLEYINEDAIQPYEELGVTNDFMFGKIMSEEKNCRPFLETILGIKIKKIKYIDSQKSIDGKIDSKGIRLDIYTEDDTVKCKQRIPKTCHIVADTIPARLICGRFEKAVIMKNSKNVL